MMVLKLSVDEHFQGRRQKKKGALRDYEKDHSKNSWFSVG